MKSKTQKGTEHFQTLKDNQNTNHPLSSHLGKLPGYDRHDSLVYYICAYLCMMWVQVWACHGARCTCGGQRTHLGHPFSLFLFWVPGTDSGSSAAYKYPLPTEPPCKSYTWGFHSDSKFQLVRKAEMYLSGVNSSLKSSTNSTLGIKRGRGTILKLFI